MNTLKLLNIYTLLTIFSISMISCNDEEKSIDITHDNLVAKWQYIWQQGYKQDRGIYEDINLDLSDKEWYLILKENGNMENTNENEGFHFTGSWRLSNRKIIFDYPSHVEEYSIVELKGKHTGNRSAI